jgi:hypothetical protein
MKHVIVILPQYYIKKFLKKEMFTKGRDEPSGGMKLTCSRWEARPYGSSKIIFKG